MPRCSMMIPSTFRHLRMLTASRYPSDVAAHCLGTVCNTVYLLAGSKRWKVRIHVFDHAAYGILMAGPFRVLSGAPLHPAYALPTCRPRYSPQAMKLGDCEVWIACDGEPLPEYSVAPEGDHGKKIACFIPSEAGKVKIFVFYEKLSLLIMCLILFHRSSLSTSGTIVERICAS